jgi:hypothetical protein
MPGIGIHTRRRSPSPPRIYRISAREESERELIWYSIKELVEESAQWHASFCVPARVK